MGVWWGKLSADTGLLTYGDRDTDILGKEWWAALCMRVSESSTNGL